MLRFAFALCVWFWLESSALALSPHHLERADGSVVTYHLDRGDDGRRRGLLLMLQGSGCEPVIERPWLRTEPRLLAPDHAVLAIEKYGVPAPDTPAIEGCSTSYWRGNTLQQRVADAVQVIARLRRERWWNRRLIIYGGSEGGAVAVMLAPLLPETVAVIVQSSGIGWSVGALVRGALPEPAQREFDLGLAAARADPSGDRRMGGASHRWWAEAADLVPARMLLQTNAPILLLHGTRDQSAPVATARAARDLVAASGRRNLTYVECEGYDHSMVDAAGTDHRGEVVAQMAGWLRSRKGRSRLPNPWRSPCRILS